MADTHQRPMNEATIKRLFPNASKSVIEANLQDYGQAHTDNPRKIAEPKCPIGNESLAQGKGEKAIDEKREINYLRPMELDIENLYECYLRLGSVHKAGDEFNICGETVRKHLMKSGKPLSRTKWTDEELTAIKIAYAAPHGFDSFILAKAINRTVAAIYCKADALGLCADRGKHIRTPLAILNMSKAQKEVSARPGVLEKRAKAVSDSHKKNGHPRGFLGHKRKPDELKKMKAGSKAAWDNPKHRVNSDEYRQAISDRASKSAATRTKENAYSNAKSGWVEVGGKRFFARSRWEANYGRVLEWRKKAGEILEWEHEPKTFWFEGIKRGVRSYLPDFRVTTKSGGEEWHEVKGWMDGKSKTKIKRMAKYHPSEKLIIIDQARYKQISKSFSAMIAGWAK